MTPENPRRLRRRLAAAAVVPLFLLPSACSRAETQAPQFPSTGTHAERAPIQEKNALPPITGKWYEGDEPVTPAAVVTVENGEYADMQFAEILPTAYKEAFLETINHPLFKLAAKKGNIRSIRVLPSAQDNGNFNLRDKSVNFFISDGYGPTEQGVYFNKRLFKTTGIHEATHGLNQDWNQYLETNTIPEDKTLTEKINRVRNACKVVRDSLYRDFISDNRDAIADAFLETSKRFNLVLQDPEVIQVYGIDRVTNYVQAMEFTSQAMLEDQPEIYAPFTNPGCEAVSIFEVPYYVKGVRGKLLDNYTIYQEATPLIPVAVKQYYNNDQEFTCLKDGKATKTLLGTRDEIFGGHAFSNPDEATSSLITILATAPNYLPKCLDGLTGHRRAQLKEVIRTSLALTEYVHPEVIQLLRQNPDAARVIDKYTY